MNTEQDKSFKTPPFAKMSKRKINHNSVKHANPFRGIVNQDNQSRLNPYQLKINPKFKASSRGYSCLTQEKGANSGIDELVKNSEPYRQLLAKMKKLEHQHNIQKQSMIKSINSKNQKIIELKEEQHELNKQKNDLLSVEAHLQQKLNRLKEQNDRIREYIELCQNGALDMEVLQYAMNPDTMTYQQLLELEQKMGSVSKGFTEQQMLSLPIGQYNSDKTDQLQLIINPAQGQTINIFNCRHRFHHDCISSWLLKERICPMCKQEIELPVSMPQ